MKSNFRKIITSSFLFIFSLTLFVFGQNPPDSSKNSLTSGSWSLQFQIEKDFTLGNFQGTNVSAKKHFSKNSAIRFGISLSGNINNSDREIEYENVSRNIQNSDDNTTSINLSGYYLYYLHAKNKINLFLGTGPIFGVTSSNREANEEVGQDSLFRKVKVESDRDSWRAGVHFLIGTEWFITKHLSLMAEYGSTLSYTKYNMNDTRTIIYIDDEESVRKSSSKNSRYSFNASAVKFGLSVYF